MPTRRRPTPTLRRTSDPRVPPPLLSVCLSVTGQSILQSRHSTPALLSPHISMYTPLTRHADDVLLYFCHVFNFTQIFLSLFSTN